MFAMVKFFNMMVFNQKEALKKYLSNLIKNDKTTGFVPTMGALHNGHLSLVARALAENNVAVVSIFVNPTQFNNTDDLVNYPKTLHSDVAKLQTLSEEIIVFAPAVTEIYVDGITSEVFDFDGLDTEMEGKHRENHFNGVATVLKKLFEIVEPTHAYFGEKDYQQLQIVKKLVEKQQLLVKIIGCNIVREANGLAMSSRNERLESETRQKAGFIYKTLVKAKENFATKTISELLKWVTDAFKKNHLFQLEYVEVTDADSLKPIRKKIENKTYRIFIAVYAKDVRLIDNIVLN